MDIATVQGIALPKPASAKRACMYPFATMDVGAMFFLPGRTTDQFATYAGLWGRKLNRRFKTRTLYMRRDNAKSPWEECAADVKDAVRGVGCWRFE